MPVDRPILISDDGKLLLDADGTLADPACCCGNCTDPNACNYNPNAAIDDGSCFYPSVACDSVSASLSKCGFPPFHLSQCTAPYADLGYSDEFSFTGCSAEFGDCAQSMGDAVDPGALYLTRTDTQSGTTAESVEFGCDTNCDTCGTAVSTSYYDPAENCSSLLFGDPDGEVTCCDPCFGCEDCETQLGCPPFLSHPVTGGAALSDEYTTALLISNAVAALPEFDGVFDGTCSAFRDLSDDETSYTIRRFRYKITIPDPKTRNVALTWVERFTPEGGGSPTDTPGSETILAGNTETIVHAINEPGDDGTITVEDVHCAYA